jgi:hypothetical protein
MSSKRRSCKYGYELSVSIYSVEFHNKLHEYLLIKKDIRKDFCVNLHIAYMTAVTELETNWELISLAYFAHIAGL